MTNILKNKFTYIVAGGLIAMGILVANYSAATYIPTPTPNNGSYTPTLTGVTNVAATTAYDGQYLRVGNVVQVSVRVEIDPTIASLTEVGISLPIASNIAGLEGVSGTCADSGGLQQSGGVEGDAANNRAQLGYNASTTTSESLYCTFGYTIIP